MVGIKVKILRCVEFPQCTAQFLQDILIEAPPYPAGGPYFHPQVSAKESEAWRG